MAKSLILVCLAMLLSSITVAASAESRCGDSSPATYTPAPGDSANSTHLQAARKMPSSVIRLEVNVCAGELKIERGAGGKMELRITSPGADRSLREYLHDFDASGTTAHVDVRVPNNYHGAVTLLVPGETLASSEVNLGAGTLQVEGSAVGQGSREVNLGAGEATVVLHGDRGYARLKVNVGMGRFEDQRPGGGTANLVVSREMEGAGKGELEINVGTGRLILKPASE
jgi:hypothetical protein